MDEFLVKVLAEVDLQYSIIEKECLILRKLLKPWPKKREQSQENQGQNARQTDDHEKEKNDGLTPCEKLALEQMDHLLNKAQRAIKIKEKMAMRTSIADSDFSRSNNIEKDNKDILESEQKYVISKKPEKIAGNGDIDRCSKDDMQEKKITKKEIPPVKKAIHLQKRVASVSSTKELKSSHLVSSRLSSKSTTPRPSSSTSNSRPSSSKSRYTPAHVNAPFKTDVNTTVPQRKHNHIYKNHLNKPPQKKNSAAAVRKQSSLLNGLKTLPKIVHAVRDNETDANANPEEDKELTHYTYNSVEIEAIPVSECMDSPAQEKENTKFGGQLKDEEPRVSCRSVVEVLESADQRPLKQEEFFSLKDKSSKVKISPKLHKLVTENHSLLEKCSTAKLVKKMPNADTAQNFVDRLIETNEIDQELRARVKAMSCLQSHVLMLKSLHSLKIEAMSETTPFETVYKAKKLLEFTLSKFAQTQDEADYFSRVQFRPTQSCEMILSNNDIIKPLFSNEETELTKHQNDKFVLDALARSKLWTQLKFEKHLHQLQLHLLHLSGAECWRILCSDHKNGSVVQMVHSLLTSSGEFFPAIVGNPYS